jgi:hypothetical protein
MWYISHSILLKPKLLWRSAPRDAFNVVNNGTSAYTTVDEKELKWIQNGTMVYQKTNGE